MPLYFIRTIADLPDKLPNVFRLIVVDEIPLTELNEQLIRKLKKILWWECSRQGWQGCLALNTNQAIYYNPETKEFKEDKKVPSHSNWLNEYEFINHEIMELASGKIRSTTSPTKEIYFVGQEFDFNLINQINSMGHSLAITELSNLNS
jgi:hypothetical protein